MNYLILDRCPEGNFKELGNKKSKYQNKNYTLYIIFSDSSYFRLLKTIFYFKINCNRLPVGHGQNNKDIASQNFTFNLCQFGLTYP